MRLSIFKIFRFQYYKGLGLYIEFKIWNIGMTLSSEFDNTKIWVYCRKFFKHEFTIDKAEIS